MGKRTGIAPPPCRPLIGGKKQLGGVRNHVDCVGIVNNADPDVCPATSRVLSLLDEEAASRRTQVRHLDAVNRVDHVSGVVFRRRASSVDMSSIRRFASLTLSSAARVAATPVFSPQTPFYQSKPFTAFAENATPKRLSTHQGPDLCASVEPECGMPPRRRSIANHANNADHIKHPELAPTARREMGAAFRFHAANSMAPRRHSSVNTKALSENLGYLYGRTADVERKRPVITRRYSTAGDPTMLKELTPSEVARERRKNVDVDKMTKRRHLSDRNVTTLSLQDSIPTHKELLDVFEHRPSSARGTTKSAQQYTGPQFLAVVCGEVPLDGPVRRSSSAPAERRHHMPYTPAVDTRRVVLPSQQPSPLPVRIPSPSPARHPDCVRALMAEPCLPAPQGCAEEARVGIRTHISPFVPEKMVVRRCTSRPPPESQLWSLLGGGRGGGEPWGRPETPRGHRRCSSVHNVSSISF